MRDFYEKLKHRDESAIQKLYNDYVKLVYHIAYSYTKNKEDSEDIVSEVFTKILNSLDTYVDKGKLKEWICMITRNTACNYVTRDKHKDVLHDDEIITNYKANDNNHTEMLDLFNAYLDEDTIHIMILRFIYDYKFKDIALITGMTIGKVQGLYYDGLETLRKEASI